MNHPAASSGVSTNLSDWSIAPRGGEFDPQRLTRMSRIGRIFKTAFILYIPVKRGFHVLVEKS
jgi:hypothetical protein